jgi:protein-tyrosine phosphatase
VRAVVNVTPDVPCFFGHGGVAYARVNIDDNEHSSFDTTMLHDASAFIAEHTQGGDTVLVHCVMGRSRSVCVCCYHFMKQYDMTFGDIYSLIQLGRPQVRVNQNFIHNLVREFPDDESLRAFIAASEVTRG